MAPRRGHDSGVALILVAGVLGLLAVLAAPFVTLAQLERRASLQRLHATRAFLLARSGLEDALARLSAGQTASYGGEDWKDDGYDAADQAQEVYRPGELDTAGCPARYALRPSFWKGRGTPDLAGVDGRLRGLSGGLAAGFYALKVEDESAKLDVNGGLLDAGDRDADGIPDHRDPDIRSDPGNPKDTGTGWNFQLARVLDILGTQPAVDVPGLGSLVLANRPPGGYRSVAAMQSDLGIPGDLSPYLTTGSWADAKVVHPNAFPGLGFCAGMSDVKKGRRPLALEAGGRPPVNLNAAPEPVLVALIQELGGIARDAPSAGGVPIAIPAGMARAIAQEILARRRAMPFSSWGDFGAFCESLVPGVIVGLTFTPLGGEDMGGADLLKANFDPNTRLAKEIPDQLLWRWIDKSDLTTWSTEGSLHPTGRFRVTAVGRVLDGGGRVLAQSESRGGALFPSPPDQPGGFRGGTRGSVPLSLALQRLLSHHGGHRVLENLGRGRPLGRDHALPSPVPSGLGRGLRRGGLPGHDPVRRDPPSGSASGRTRSIPRPAFPTP